MIHVHGAWFVILYSTLLAVIVTLQIKKLVIILVSLLNDKTFCESHLLRLHSSVFLPSVVYHHHHHLEVQVNAQSFVSANSALTTLTQVWLFNHKICKTSSFGIIVNISKSYLIEINCRFTVPPLGSRLWLKKKRNLDSMKKVKTTSGFQKIMISH